uniref:EOG090X0APF n=1 Tax=Eubosmina coregoni TaxID=186181 RepID=A0A4Y7LM02_9CRUS|nr:EOG090X0APF [Eubosmina coregoni]SVE69970.1 EOG090X0APF [Eubosmina coregoni]
MKLSHLGKHCTEKTCNQLDFLPMKCDACDLIFCKDHVRYELHKCGSSYKKNVQVPVCPLCNQPVPGKRGEAPDIAVSEHIDRDCQSDPAKQKRKVFGNRCTMKGCKQKEVVPIVCDQCKMNFCLKHRHTIDHGCKGPAAPVDKAREAALARASASSSSSGSNSAKANFFSKHFNPPTTNRPSASQTRSYAAASVQGNMSEDEALARALQASLQDQPPQTSAQQQEEFDRALALALQRGEQPTTSPATTPATTSSNNCSLS